MSCSREELKSGWLFKQDCPPFDQWRQVSKVPTQIHLDLQDHKLIPDPFQDINEKAVEWVGESVWWYKTSFETPTAASANDKATTDLVFEGLDTFATVWLNGTEILNADNMFLSHRVDVTNLIQGSDKNKNELLFRFDSALFRGRELVEKHSHEHSFLVRQTEAGRIPVRKAQYNWGWDWGPILMTAGPWKPVLLEQYVARIDDFWAQYQVSADLETVSGSFLVHAAGSLQQNDKVVLSLSHANAQVLEKETKIKGNHAKCTFELHEPKLWFPKGYGPQNLYTLKVKLIRNDQELDLQSRLIGFRKTELVQEADEHGKSFYFRINGIDVFAGGSCWIPADSMQARISTSTCREWIKLLAEGNQVMIRVWGGGVYENDALINACDEFGVLIWHDFQFACASYPTYPSFLESVEKEARQHVRRLRWHPSMVIWAGNNEDYQVQERYKLDYHYSDKNPDNWLKSSFPARYIYEHLLPKIVRQEDPHMIYHPSSPWGDGKPTADPTVGDIHQWNLWHGTMNKFQDASKLGGRFVSEFGMEAYPHISTIDSMNTCPSQRHQGSMVMESHNKAVDHERRMLSYVAENFQLKTELEAFIHLTQIVQADTMRRAYKSWRRDWKDRRCGGVLVWQLNDCWPTISWAIVDYYLVKKPAYYAISRALREMDVGVSRTVHDWTSVFVDKTSALSTAQVDHTMAARGGTFDVWVASSSTKPKETQVIVRFISISSGEEIQEQLKESTTVSPNSTTEVIVAKPLSASIPNADNHTIPFNSTNWNPYVVHVALFIDDALVAADTAWPEPIKYLELPCPGLCFSVSPQQDRVDISAKRPVKGFVFQETAGLWLSDNGFDVVPGFPVTVQVRGPLKADELKYTYIGCPRGSVAVTDESEGAVFQKYQ